MGRYAAAFDPTLVSAVDAAWRFVRTYTDSEGAWNLHARNNPEVGAQIMAVIDSIRDRLFAEARAQGRHEPSEARWQYAGQGHGAGRPGCSAAGLPGSAAITTR